jgi:DNA helicase-2/ATP-dependent DNA helicase PcrA
VNDRILEPLDAEQRAVATASRGTVVVVAAAGSGKTRAITHRIAYAIATQAQPADTGLALSFTNRAAHELRSRISQLGVPSVTTSTFHAAALRQLTHFWPQVLGGSPWKVVTGKAQVLAEAIRSVGLDLSTAERRALVADLEWAKSSGLSPTEFPSSQRLFEYADTGATVAVWQEYQSRLTTKRQMDFDDVLSLTLGMLQQRPDVVEQIRKRYTWFTVDEFQDVTPLQRALLDVWVGNRTELCVVGDVAQTIYSFAGAQASFLENLAVHHPEATVVKLNRTYRCPENVVQLANSLLQAGDEISRGGIFMTSESPQPGVVTTTLLPTAEGEAQSIAAHIQRLHEQGHAYQDMAILVRLHSQGLLIGQALEERGVPFVAKGLTSFWDRPEIKQVLLELRVLSYAVSGGDLRQAVVAVLDKNGWQSDVQGLNESARERWFALSAFLNLVDEILGAQPNASLMDFFEFVAQRTVTQHEPSAQAVSLMTIHSAKGLEWETVFVPGLNEGVLPYFSASSESAIREERRLLYVAMTRAKSGLYLSGVESGQNSPSLSRFLAEMNLEAVVTPSVASVTRPHTQQPMMSTVARCRMCNRGLVAAAEVIRKRCDVCPADVPQHLVDALTAWRREIATQLATIDWLVMSDATIQALAELQPQTLEELGAVHGINPNKLRAFGDQLLEIIADSQQP